MKAAVALLSSLMSGLLAATVLPLHAAGTVEVSYVEPEKFSDIGFGTVDRERVLGEMTSLLKALGAKLPDGQTLKVEVLDVDLAGRLQPRRGDEIRVLNGRADWPRIKLRWTLSAGDRTLKSGEDDLADMAYLQTFGGLDRSLSLPYEGRMLERWFAERVAGVR